MLRNHKSAIRWTIADIKGISPSFCMHKILLKDDQKPSVKSQRRLNPIMKEVVKKEIIKWLDAGIIYPISDSSWVSPVQCVPKKGGITVVESRVQGHQGYIRFFFTLPKTFELGDFAVSHCKLLL
ncbi:hypothetical protein CDL12_15709 [Handroanthus impetiginosus]|uniref:Uncharacterized protein n=1 Tax=Handroanthus impetiginosus TaxID=429701 RepID=A0A2G9H2E2_9LAMI|nr:hypothetical protein CDL12_15709 [Handroanthus impetiginosus]